MPHHEGLDTLPGEQLGLREAAAGRQKALGGADGGPAECIPPPKAVQKSRAVKV
jgi:hypothetical protein